MNLEGRVVTVTGGGRHLGRTYCLGMAAEGARIVVADLLDPQPVVDEIIAAGGDAIGVSIDVRRPETLTAMADAAVSRYGRIDVLLNNAGYFKEVSKGPFEDIDLDEWDRCYQINVRGTWLATRAVIGHMKRAGSGKIINVGSTTCLNGIPGFLHYVTAKSALLGMSRALARELGEFGITVNTLVPDLIPDPDQLAANPTNNERAIAGRCLKRTQEPADMVGAAVFLASSGSDFMSGQSINVNGGNVFV